LLHELGTLRDLANEGDLMPEAEAVMLDGPAAKSLKETLQSLKETLQSLKETLHRGSEGQAACTQRRRPLPGPDD
jgi:hypothetical protein